MTDSIPHVVTVKNKWLFDQVEVEFPTPESLRGRSVYKNLCDSSTTSVFEPSEFAKSYNLDDIFQVDFHRLTVMFSILQASRGENEQQQNDLVEFFTQIIFSEPCALYVAFHQSEPVAAAIVTEWEDQLLVSDIVIKSSEVCSSKEQFAASVIDKWNGGRSFDGTVYIEQ